MTVEQVEQYLKNAKKGEIVIYGARNNARYLYEYLYTIGMKNKIAYFLVSSAEGNPSKIEGINVFELKGREQVADKIVFIAMSNLYFGEVADILRGYGCNHIIFWTNDLIFQTSGKFIIKSFAQLFAEKNYYLSESPYDNTYLDIKSSKTKQYYKVTPLGGGMPYNNETRKLLNEYDFDEEYNKIFGRYKHISQLKKTDNANLNPKDFNIYMVESHVDHPIKDSTLGEEYLIPVQAGAKLTNIEKCKLKDSSGDSISQKNRTLAEMTAIYWVWKNSPTALYKGICHYRRRFILTHEDFLSIKTADVDVVLDIPRFVLPNCGGNFIKHHLFLRSDLKLTMDIIHKKQPEYFETAKQQMEHNLFYPCNMMIAKEEIFEEYCEFVFSIILELENHFDKQGITRTDRFSAYISELISSIFWVHNKNRFHIAVAEFQLLN